MNLLVLLMIGCTPQDAEFTDATYHVWLGENSSATVDEEELDLSSAQYLDCTDETLADTGLELGVDYLCPSEEGATIETGGSTSAPPLGPTSAWLDEVGPNYWLNDDAYYVMNGDMVAWRSEALMTSEGDFQLTVHHDLGDGQDFRFAFVIDPVFKPSVCIQENQTCFNGDDDDADGLADYDDPDCLYSGWEVGYDSLHCNDGQDNDGDGLIDLADDGCDHPFDAVEATDSAQCTDGQDNDGDGWTDDDDPDCAEIGADEDGRTNGNTACNDDIDNDGDGLTDADDTTTDTDGGCLTAWDNDEAGYTSYDVCEDRVDNDFDGWIDAQDSDCERYGVEVGYQPYACNDGLDNDGDGDFDSDDVDCFDLFDNSEDTNDATCTDGTDNDADGWTDGDDPDCVLGTIEDSTFVFPCSDPSGSIDPADCDNGFDVLAADAGGDCTDTGDADEDGDGWINTADPDCFYFIRDAELGFSTFACNDGQDNDGDTFVDTDDADCLSPLQGTEEPVDANCDDGEDNDGDGWVDFDDADCIFGLGEDGTNNDLECADGIDNDGDGDIDGEDSDCPNGLDPYETNGWSCDDGIDNDGDGWTDAAEDPDCAERAYEYAFSIGQCTDGADNDGDGDIDSADADCLSPLSSWEQTDLCADGIDNDGDGWADNNDPGCIAFNSPDEGDGFVSAYACNDGQDNDGDGLMDSQDPDCESARDNIEDSQEGGDPIPFVLDYGDTLEKWSEDEDGYTIYYLNAGAYQQEPAGEDPDIWSLPQEWRAGYGHAKFAAEEFDALPTLFGDAVPGSDDYQTSYLGLTYDDPDQDEVDRKIEAWYETASIWAQELSVYGLLDWDEFDIKIEDNQWRPVDLATSGLDNWLELNTSWVRIKDGSDFSVGGQVEGDYQIYFLGRESSSSLIVKGSFKTTNVREDKWGYEVLEDEKFEQNGTSACEF